MNKTQAFNETVIFKDPHHEALIGVWWTGPILKKHASRYFRQRNSNDIQFSILMPLKVEVRPLNQQKLNDRLFVDKSNLTGVAGRMETAALIERADALAGPVCPMRAVKSVPIWKGRIGRKS